MGDTDVIWGKAHRRMTYGEYVCETTDDNWEIEYTDDKGNKYTETVSFDRLPEDECKEFVLGFSRCLALERGWIKSDTKIQA